MSSEGHGGVWWNGHAPRNKNRFLRDKYSKLNKYINDCDYQGTDKKKEATTERVESVFGWGRPPVTSLTRWDSGALKAAE